MSNVHHSFAGCWASDMYDAPRADEILPLPHMDLVPSAAHSITQAQQQMMYQQQQNPAAIKLSGWASLMPSMMMRMQNNNSPAAMQPKHNSPPSNMIGGCAADIAGSTMPTMAMRKRGRDDGFENDNFKMRRFN